MRQIVLDTETTGINPKAGHRIVEIACLELFRGEETGKVFQRYINPTIAMPSEVQKVHGLSNEFLSDKPIFAEIADEFIDFIREAELIIHNAPFDIGFINCELSIIGKGTVADYCPSIIDTCKIARIARPGKKNSLDALCKDMGIDNSARTLHGALLDVQLLAQVYKVLNKQN